MRKTPKRAQTLVEYGLIFAIITVFIVIAANKFMGTINTVGNKTNTVVSSSGDYTMKKYCESVNKTYNTETGDCE